MKKSPLRIGNLTFEYPFVLAPLAGITDRSMRSLCCEAGASLTFTEMVSAKGLWYGDRKTGELLQTGWMGEKPQEGPVGFQLFGREPMILEYAVRLLADPDHAKAVDAEMAAKLAEEAEAAEAGMSGAAKADELAAGGEDADSGDREAPNAQPGFPGIRAPLGARTVGGLRPPALFDLNAGCPVPKIVRNGEGSALLRDPELLHDCIAAMVRGAKAAAGGSITAEGSARGGTASAPSIEGRHVMANAGTVSMPAANPASAGDAGLADQMPGSAPGPRYPIPVTVKIRKGFERDDDCAVEIARAAEAAGAAAITVHGRTRAQFYEGKADWDVIAKVKAAVKLPVIGNGDVLSGEDAIRMMEETGCDGVMIARGALGNPWIFAQARALWDGMSPAEAELIAASSPRASEAMLRTGAMRLRGAVQIPADAESAQGYPLYPTDEQRIDQLLRHIDLVCADKGERTAVREMRKHVGWYIKGMRGATQIRRQINTAGTVDEMRRILGR